MNSLPKTVTQKCRGCNMNPGPSATESSTLTTRLPSHMHQIYSEHKVYYYSTIFTRAVKTCTKIKDSGKDKNPIQPTDTILHILISIQYDSGLTFGLMCTIEVEQSE